VQAYTIPSALPSSSLRFLFISRPFSLQGKCATGIAKNELEGSAIPANMLYHAMKAAMMPNTPPARVRGTFGAPSSLRSRYEQPRQMKAIQTIMNRELKATVDFRVQSQTMKVKMNQAKIWYVVSTAMRYGYWTWLDTHVESQHGVEVRRLAAIRGRNLEAARDEYDGKTHPESAIGRQCGTTERVACDDGKQRSSTQFGNEHGLPSAISHMPANSWMNPPYASAGAMTMFGWFSPATPKLITLSRNVVNAKPASPRGAGLANLNGGGLYRPGW